MLGGSRLAFWTRRTTDAACFAEYSRGHRGAQATGRLTVQPRSQGARSWYLSNGVACVGALTAVGVCASINIRCQVVPNDRLLHACAEASQERVPLSSGGRRGPLPAAASAGEAVSVSAAAARPMSMPPPLLTMDSSHDTDLASAPEAWHSDALGRDVLLAASMANSLRATHHIVHCCVQMLASSCSEALRLLCSRRLCSGCTGTGLWSPSLTEKSLTTMICMPSAMLQTMLFFGMIVWRILLTAV